MTSPIWLVAGGTGGHLWPAAAFGQWLQARDPGARPLLLAGNRPLEREILEAAKLPWESLPLEGSPLGASGRARWDRWRGVVRAWLQCRAILRRDRPWAAVLFGGYISLPALGACLEARVPVLVHEQNARAGRTTRMAAAMGVPVASGWEDCEPLRYGSFRYVGIPLRSMGRLQIRDAWNKLSPGVCRFRPGERHVLVLGGSLGSSFLGRQVRRIAQLPPFRQWVFLLLGGESEGETPENCLVWPRQWDMAPLYAGADLVISRGGGATLAELLLLGIPALVVPWQGALDGHQACNAAAFVKLGGGNVVQEDSPPEAFEEALFSLSQEKRRQTTDTGPCANERLWRELVEVVTTKGDAFHNGRR